MDPAAPGIVFICYLAHDLLDRIFQSHNPRSPAVLINHHSQLQSLVTQQQQLTSSTYDRIMQPLAAAPDRGGDRLTFYLSVYVALSLLGAAVGTAATLPPPLGDGLLASARGALTGALQVLAALAVALVLAAGLLVQRLLRGGVRS